jgi:hypothetical protein
MRRYRAAKRSKTIGRFAADLRRERDARKMEALCGRMFAKFGGVDKFAAAWKANLDAAPRGSRGAFDTYFALFRLMETVDARRRAESDVSGLTDEELRAEYDRCVTDKAVRLLAGLS